jgi:ribosomal protein S15P/S13E
LSNITKKQIANIKKHRKEHPKEENHKRRTRLIKETPWWIPMDRTRGKL